MTGSFLSTVPGHLSEQERHSAGTGDAGEEESTTDDEGQGREPWVHGERQHCAGRCKRADDDLHLPHEREHFANAAVDRKSGVDPGLRAALDQDAIVASGTLELFDGVARPWARLAKHVDGRARLMLCEKSLDPELAKRD